MYFVWRLILTLLVLSGCFAPYVQTQAAPLSRPHAQSSGDPLVLAFYYTWFDEQTWTYDKLSDLPSQTYVSRDRGVMGRHIDEAKRAGIDAFMVAWYGPHGEFNQTEPNLAALNATSSATPVSRSQETVLALRPQLLHTVHQMLLLCLEALLLLLLVGP